MSNQILKIESATQQGSASTPEGISFTYPAEWHATTEKGEEGDAQIVYRNNPDLTVTFKTFADKGSWQKRIDEWKDEIKEGNATEKDARIGGLSAKLLTTEEFKYYYVDTGTRWFEISATNDRTSPEIDQIIRSVYFEDAAFGAIHKNQLDV